MIEIIKREIIYIWYYFSVQLGQIFWYWVAGMVIGSVISVFFKDRIHNLMRNMKGDGSSLVGIIFASVLCVLALTGCGRMALKLKKNLIASVYCE